MINREDWINAIIRHVAELPDRSSPDDHPEMMLVSADELREAIQRIAPFRQAISREPSQAMCAAAANYVNALGDHRVMTYANIWRAMFDAALARLEQEDRR